MSGDFRPINKRTGEVKDMTLVDDLADVMSHIVVGWKTSTGVDLAKHPDVVRVMGRYRQSKIQQAIDGARPTHVWVDETRSMSGHRDPEMDR